MKNTGNRVASKQRYRQRREEVIKKQATRNKVTSTWEYRREEVLVLESMATNCAVTKTKIRTKTLK